MATVKVSGKTYQTLNEIADRLRSRLRRPVSVEEALGFVLRQGKLRPSGCAGTFSLTDEEEREIRKTIEEFWSRRKLRSE